jgi:hypothetical protein
MTGRGAERGVAVSGVRGVRVKGRRESGVVAVCLVGAKRV